MYHDNKILIGMSGDEKVYLYPKMANRHGMIAGATGTGEALVSVLDEDGVPTSDNLLNVKYSQEIDRESAYELLKKKVGAEEEKEVVARKRRSVVKSVATSAKGTIGRELLSTLFKL